MYSEVRDAKLPQDLFAYVLGVHHTAQCEGSGMVNDVEETLKFKVRSWPQTTQRNVIQRLDTWQDVGDKAFLSGKFGEAVKTYTLAIDCIKRAKVEALLVILYLNRAAAYMKFGEFFKSIADCTSGLRIVPNNPKCLQRRAMAYVAENRAQL